MCLYTNLYTQILPHYSNGNDQGKERFRSLVYIQKIRIMKKLSIYFLLLLPVVLLTGCYSNYNYTKFIHNKSDHTVIATFQCCGSEEMKSIEIASGEKESIHMCIYQVTGEGPDCSENPTQITLVDEFGAELGNEIQKSANWYRSKKNLNIECTFVIPEKANTKN